MPEYFFRESSLSWLGKADAGQLLAGEAKFFQTDRVYADEFEAVARTESPADGS
jgi:hypothetical protein